MTINFLLRNADLLTISVFIFLGKTYLQKPHCLTIKNISSNKAGVKIFLKKNKNLKKVRLEESI